MAWTREAGVALSGKRHPMTNARDIPIPERATDPIESDADGRVDLERDISNGPLPMTDAEPDVGLSQKGTDADAVLRRETEI
jgi:hypothetical protein